MARQGFKVFDSDMHIMEPPDLWQRYIDKEFLDQAPRGRTSDNVRDLGTIFPKVPLDTRRTGGTPHRGKNFDKNQDIYRNHAERGWTGAVQLEAMDTEGIDSAVLFPTRGLGIQTFPNQDPRFAAAMARAYNDWLHDFCSANPNRLFGAGMISVYDLDDALRETRRVAEEYQFRSVFLRSNIVNGKNWFDPYYEPLWDLLEELNLPLGFHEASASRSKQAAEHFEPNFGIRRVYAQPFEQMMGMGAFLAGGILERHPKMKVAFLEANCSWLPWLLWRLDEGFEREGDVFMADCKMPPSEYFKRQCWISIEPDETPARYTIAEFGCDQLVFSTDYPHGDSKFPHAVESFLKLDLPDEDKRKILWDNCARFYGAGESSNPLKTAQHQPQLHTKKGEAMETQTQAQTQSHTDNENAKERFIRKTRELFAKESDMDKRWNGLRPVLAELLADPDMIEASKTWPDCVPANGRAENLLFYEDPDFGFAINGLTKGAARQGVAARIHDHAHIYTLYGVIDGHEKVVRYERLDDRSKPDYAKIQESANVLCGPGEIDLVKPYEIHTELTVGERTVAVIIRSQKGGDFNQGRYNPETNEYYESLGPRQTPCEMMPK